MLAKEKLYIDRVTKQVMHDVADEIANSLINLSPISSGKYIRSFVVSGIGSPEIVHAPSEEVSEGLPAGKRAALRETERTKLKKRLKEQIIRFGPTKSSKKIGIGNQAGHALIVEFLGWAGTPAYRVFGKTKAYINLVKNSIMKKAMAKVKKP